MDWDLEEEILNDIMRFEFSPFLSALEFFVCKIGRNSKSFLLKHCYRIIFSVRVIPENSIFDPPHHYNMQKNCFGFCPCENYGLTF